MPVDRIDNASGGFAAAPRPTATARSEGRSFQATLQAEKASAAKPRTTGAADDGEAREAASKPKVPRGERHAAVEGHRYAEITAGPRNGMFINTSGNKRDGQAFTLVERDGFHFHIYGTGADRRIFRVPGDDDKANDAKPSSGTTKPDAVKPDAVKPPTGGTPAA